MIVKGSDMTRSLLEDKDSRANLNIAAVLQEVQDPPPHLVVLHYIPLICRTSS